MTATHGQHAGQVHLLQLGSLMGFATAKYECQVLLYPFGSGKSHLSGSASFANDD